MIINKEEVENFIEKETFQVPYNGSNKFYNEDKVKGIKLGVEFAEENFRDLAVEFAKWIVDSAIKCPFIPDKYEWYYNNENFCANDTEELFEIFIKERNEKEIKI